MHIMCIFSNSVVAAFLSKLNCIIACSNFRYRINKKYILAAYKYSREYSVWLMHSLYLDVHCLLAMA